MSRDMFYHVPARIISVSQFTNLSQVGVHSFSIRSACDGSFNHEVTNAKYSSSSSSEASIDNIGFAIPINGIRSIVESIIEKGYISKPYIGISVLDVSEETQQYGIPAGAAVQAVTEGGPAAQAGLQKGDVITAVNGTPVTSDELVDFVGAASVDDTLVISIYRQGDTLELTVVVGEQIQSALEQEEESRQQTQQGYPGNFPWGNGGRP